MIKFTVMIPTRERCETLHHTLASCVAQDYPEFEIIVSDNASTDNTRAVVAAFDDPRIRYIETGRRLSMAGNFEFALNHATGEYMMFLGDDDGLAPGALRRVADLVRETGQQAIISSQALYYWPNALDERTRHRLVFSAREGYEIRASHAMIRRVLSFQVAYTELPGLYVGFVSRRIVESARDGGVYFHSVTPDAYSGFVNAAVLDSYAYVHTPFSLAGISGRSNGAAHLGPKRSSEANLFDAENHLQCHPALVTSPSYEIITAEAFLTGRDHVPALSAFELDIKRLCDVALLEAPTWNYSKIEETVREIRAKHGLQHPSSTGSKSKLLQRRSSLRRVLRGTRRVLNAYRNIDCRDFQVRDVRAAGELISILTAYEQHGYGSSLKVLKQWLARL